MKRTLITVVTLGLLGAGAAFANENNTYTDPYWAPRVYMQGATKQDRLTQDATSHMQVAGGYDLVDRFNP